MTTIIRVMQSPKDWIYLHSLALGMCLDGECYAFAIALHRALGWKLIGLMQDEVIRHAAVLAPNGMAFDIRGYVIEGEFARPFGCGNTYLHRRDIVEEDLFRTRPIKDSTIELARRYAETLWPELPWKESLAKRVTAFADELEALSRKHGLWIRGALPASSPLLAVGDNDEGGYELHPTVDGMTFSINRYFE